MLKPNTGRDQSGFTLLEMVVVLAIIGVLAAILTPYLTTYMDQSRIAKAQSDTRAIGEAISRFEKDVGRYPVFSSGAGLLQDSSGNIVTLRSPGNVPSETAVTAWTSGTPTTVQSDGDCSASCQFGYLADQLLLNAPGYPTNASLAKPFKWKGPYLDPTSDPWGNAYLANVTHCRSGSNDACFVLSAGPDGKVQTLFNISKNSVVAASVDDIIYRIK